MISVDLHVHTCASVDCGMPVEVLAEACLKKGIDCVAITDHNEIEGAFALRDLGKVRVIVGEEIRTTHGELQGLFLTEHIQGGLSPQETIDLIKAQGGLVCMPHPFIRSPYPAWSNFGYVSDGAFVPSSRLTRANGLLTRDVLSRLDLMETVNSRTPLKWNWAACRKLANLCGLPQTAGSDSHTPGEIGNAYIEMDDFTDATSFLDSVKRARLVGKAASPAVHYSSTMARFRSSDE